MLYAYAYRKDYGQYSIARIRHVASLVVVPLLINFIDFPNKYRKKMEYKDLFKSVSWKDSYNADSKVSIKLKWQDSCCDFCVRFE